MRFLKTAVAGVATLAAISGTSVVAFAYPEPNGHHSIHCEPGTVDAHNGSCSVVFSDKDKNDHPRYGQQVCFSVQGPGTVQPTCATTDRKGVARATYYTGAYPGDCANANNDGKATATITGTEAEGASAQTTVQIKCKQGGGGGGGDGDGDGDGDHGNGGGDHGDGGGDHGNGGGDHGNGGGDHGDGGGDHGNGGGDNGGGGDSHSHGKYNTSAAVVLSSNNGVSGAMTGVGIVAVILILAVAITGRLRLRRLRR